MEALKLYKDEALGEIVSALEEDASGKDAIEQRFASAIKASADENAWFGCLMVNSIIELAGRDEDLIAELSRMRQELEDAYYRAVNRGQKSGDISSAISPRIWAQHLTSLDMGLSVLLRSGATPKALRESVAVTLASLS